MRGLGGVQPGALGYRGREINMSLINRTLSRTNQTPPHLQPFFAQAVGTERSMQSLPSACLPDVLGFCLEISNKSSRDKLLGDEHEMEQAGRQDETQQKVEIRLLPEPKMI